MKSLILFLSLISTGVLATDNHVLSGTGQTIVKTDGEGNELPKEFFINEIVLENCNLQLETLPKGSPRKVKITFGTAVFMSDNITVQPQGNGNCIVGLGLGLSDHKN